jgi:hypothetical protein
MKNILVAGLVASASLFTATAHAEDRISAVHAFPETLIYTKSFLSFVDKVNEAGKGVIQIDVRGGPEAIGMFQQPMLYVTASSTWSTHRAPSMAAPCPRKTRWWLEPDGC